MMCEMTHSLQSGEKSWDVIIPEEQERWEPSLFQTLTGIEPLTQKTELMKIQRQNFTLKSLD